MMIRDDLEEEATKPSDQTSARETVMADLGLPKKTKQVCAACFTKITRKISQLECEPGTS